MLNIKPDREIDRKVLDDIWTRIKDYIKNTYHGVFTKNVEIHFIGNDALLGVSPSGDAYIGNLNLDYITGEGLAKRLAKIEDYPDKNYSAVTVQNAKETAENANYFYTTVEIIIRNWQKYKDALAKEATFYHDFEV